MNDSKVNRSKTLNMILIAYQPVVNLLLKTVKAQDARLHLPDLPTTTIGSFPQTREVRKYRADWKNNRISDEEYNNFLENEIARWIKIQEEIGLDVLVHGEFERNDMVEFFGEKLQGFLVTKFDGFNLMVHVL